MSTRETKPSGGSSVAPELEPLTFEKAEFAGPSGTTTCAACQQAVDVYYQVSDAVVCAACHERALAERDGGARTMRFGRALLFGGVGAVAGAAVWMTVTLLTGYEIGFIAIVVGLIVGAAVKKGARGRGGWLYQSLAVLLTYLAIVSTYVPVVYQAISQRAEELRAEHADPDASPIAAASAHDEEALPAFVAVPLLFTLVFGLAFIAPFLAGLENLIGLLIIGFALFQAWKMNKRETIQGPFRVTQEPAPAVPSA